MRMMRDIYKETQKFRQKWVLFIYVLLVSLFLLFVYAIYQQIVLEMPFGDRPAPNFVLIICAALMVALMIMFNFSKLETIISANSLKIKFSPFHRSFKEFSWTSVEKTEIIKYGFIGYGIRISSYGKAYNVSGNKGLSLKLKSGKKILIGTQKPDELAAFLRKIGITV